MRHLLALLLMLMAAPVAAQDQPSASANPLAEMYDALARALESAGVPFTAEQQRAIALMMEDRRRASEELFGGLMDFRDGPTQGEQADRLRSAIEWMRGEFMRNVEGYITPEQQGVWTQFQADQAAAASAAGAGGADEPSQTQYVRINNNPFTAEDADFGDSGFTEVIPKGGVGAWHGNAQLLLKDDALNARNPLAGNEPPYQERRISADVSGPAIANRLTTSLAFASNEQKNVSTVVATLPDGEFALGITRPYVFREFSSNSTLQLHPSHSLRANAWYATEAGRDQGIGGFTLPERGYDFDWRGWSAEVRQFSALPSQSLFEANVEIRGNSSEVQPHSDAVRINVLDAFGSGGAQNLSENDERSYEFDTLFTKVGDVLTLKTGGEAEYEDQRNMSQGNFGGTFTFSSLDDYLAGQPVNYRVTQGTPLLRTTQFEGAAFVQLDVNVTSQLTLMFGVRYDAQTNLDDFNNVSPRVSFGYSPGQATVIRGGGGLYYNGLDMGMVESQRRFDGTRQFELVVDNPSYPDPFAAGTIRQTFPSVRVTDAGLTATSMAIGQISIERTFFSNLLLSARYNFLREYGRLRMRDLNAPFDASSPILRSCSSATPAALCITPDPGRGQILSLESAGREVRHNFTVSVRKRFRILNLSAEYDLQRVHGDVQGSPGTVSTDSYDPAADWGLAPFPMHSVDATANVRLPLDVFVTARMDANTGRRYTITTGLDDNRDGNVNDRPPGVPPNSVVGPKYLDFDFNISKAFFFQGSGGPNVNVFANMTNAFNHVHYGTPSGVLTSPNFGRSTSATEPRQIEIGLRFQF